MTLKLIRHLSAFCGRKTRVRCFLHIINLVAKLIVRQFDTGNAFEPGDALAELEDNLEGVGEEYDDDDDDELMEELGYKDQEVDELVEPVQAIIKKVSGNRHL